MLNRTSQAIWTGDGLTGKGTLDTQSGALKAQPYSFHTRFVAEDGKAGTNPEELIAAAHAGCFAMALSFGLTGAGHPPVELKVSATVSMDKKDVHWFVAHITLDLEARVPGIEPARFQELAEAAQKNCPVSRALAANEITLKARLVA
jgi:osmotically inducible protein OsmC